MISNILSTLGTVFDWLTVNWRDPVAGGGLAFGIACLCVAIAIYRRQRREAKIAHNEVMVILEDQSEKLLKDIRQPITSEVKAKVEQHAEETARILTRYQRANYRYVLEKLRDAARCLVGEEPLRERLIRAWQSSHPIEHHAKRHEELLPEIREEIRKIYEGLTSRDEDKGQGKLTATVTNFSDQEALDYAHRIVSLFEKVARIHSRES